MATSTEGHVRAVAPWHNNPASCFIPKQLVGRSYIRVTPLGARSIVSSALVSLLKNALDTDQLSPR